MDRSATGTWRTRCSRWLTVALAAVLPIPAALSAQTDPRPHFPPAAELEAMVRYMVEDGEVPGMVLGVVEPGREPVVVAYGDAGPGAPPLGPGSVFGIGSVTKTFTATLLAHMVARGEVSLDDPVARYLPEHVSVPSRGGVEITLEHLATHTSGLPRQPENYRPADLRDPYAGYTIDVLYDFLSGYDLPRAPGDEYEYSNLGFGLLAHALSRAAGIPFPELMQERILEPLGMDRTGYYLDGEVDVQLVQGHARGEAVPVWSRADGVLGAGGLRSTAGDLITYVQAYMRAMQDDPETDLQRAMRTAAEVRVPRGEDGAGTGLAWGVAVFPGEAPMVTHGGSVGGFRAWIGFQPSRGLGLVWLANGREVDDPLGPSLLYADPPPATWPAADPDPATLAGYTGTYEGPAGEYYIRLEDDGFLTYQRPDLARTRLYATSDTAFYMLRGPWTVTFHREDGAVAGLSVRVDEREPEADVPTRGARKVGDDTPDPARAAGSVGLGPGLDRWARRTYLTVYAWGWPGWIGLGLVVLLALGTPVWWFVRRRG